MSLAPTLIVISFSLVILTMSLMLISTFLENKYRGLIIGHYWLGRLAGLTYAGATMVVLFDGRAWSRFKTELLILLGVFILTYISAYLGKYKKQRLLHYLMVLILALVIIIMNLKWVGLI